MTGEQVIINEDVEFQSGITALDVFTTDDIKAVFQDVATKMVSQELQTLSQIQFSIL